MSRQCYCSAPSWLSLWKHIKKCTTCKKKWIWAPLHINRKLILVCKFLILAVALEGCSVGNMIKSQWVVLEESKVAGEYPKHLVKTVPGVLNEKFIVFLSSHKCWLWKLIIPSLKKSCLIRNEIKGRNAGLPMHCLRNWSPCVICGM